MKHARERIRHSRSARPSALRIRPLSAAVAAAMGVVPVAHAAGNVIVANGRTHTRIRVHGNTTDISTSTIRGSTAYNAFSQFREASGKIVNLKIPHKAVTLLNMVYGGQTVINGVLNAYHDGRLGGHVVFADPQGLIVGAHGVLNVGALTVTTPTRAFMNRVLSASGHIDQGATQQLIAGKAPQSADGLIRIVGKINALDGISLNAAQVLETASGHLSAGAAAYTRMKLFQASVNTRGLQQATHVVAHNGVISIEGGQSAQIAGTLQASGSDHGGTIGVSAAHVTVADSARLDASGAQGGGSISIGGGPHALTQQSTAQTVDIAKGASLVANATHRGDGGHVAVWSQSGTDFGGHISARGGAAGGNGGQVEVSAHTGLNFHGTVDTRAPQGLMGDLLLDPTNLDIVNTAPSTGTAATSGTTTDSKTGAKTTTYGNLNQSPSSSSSDTSYVTVSTLQALGDTNITLQAFNQITVGDSATSTKANLDLSKTLTSGKLTLEAGGTTTTGLTTGTTGAGDIKFVSGSSIETGGGSVVLDAGAGFTGAAATDGTATLGSISTQGGDITVNAGGGIALPAGTTLDSTVSGGTAGAITLSAAQAAANGGGLLDLSTIYQSVSPVIANSATPSAATTIDVYGTIDGGKVSLSASAQAAASFAGNPQETSIAHSLYKKLGITTNTPLQAYQYTSTADAKVLIHNGAKITGEDVSLSSDAQPTINLIGNNAVPDGEYLSAMSAVLKGTSTAQIDAGATVSAAGDLSVQATAEPTILLAVKNALSGTGPSVTLAYGAANITTTAQIVTGATIDMPGGGNVDLGATNDQIFSLKASAAPTTAGNSSANIGAAAVIGNYNTQAIANEGANLSGVGDVTVSAASNTDKNVTSADTTATAGGKELKNGKLKESDQKTVLQSLFSSLLSAVKGKAGKTDTSSNSEPAASTSTSGSGTSGSTSGSGTGGSTSGSGTGGSGSGSTTSPSTTAFSLGSAVSLNLSDLSATASIAKTSGSTGSAPSISAGNVVVHAASSDPGFHNLANSETASTEPSDTTTGGSSTTGVSLAVALGWETGGAKASIGNGVTVNAANVAVGAENSTPLAFLQPFNEGLNLANELYTQAKDNFGNKGALLSSTVWTALGSTDKTAVDQFIADFKTLSSDAIAVPSNMGDQTKLLAQLKTVFANDGPALLNDYNSLPQSVKDVWDTSAVGKVVNEIRAFVTSPEGMSSYAQAKAEADKTSIAGAVNYLSLGSNAQAWVAPGATITLNALQSSQSWNSTVDGAKLKWDAPLTVQADDSTYALNGAGNGFLKGVGVTGGGGSSVGVGGAFMWVDASNSAQAWVANGVNITTAGNNLAVDASNLQRFASYAPSSGKGSGFAGNGAAAVTRVAGAIEAAIGNQATVNAGSGDVTLNAANSLDVLSIAGALAKAQQTGVGVGVALNFVDPTTSAGVLDTSSLSSGVGATAATSGQDCTATYCLTAGALNVEARTQAASIALGVAGAKAGGSSSSSTGTSGGTGTTSGTGSSGESKTGFIGTITGAFSSLKDKIKGSGQSVSGGLSKTSSAADNAQGQLSQQNTDASSTQTAATTTQSDAKSQYQGTAADTQAADAGGSSTSDTSGQPKMSLAIAGSVAANINKSQTQATLDAAKIKLTGSGGANVLAANDSLDLALAGAGAISSSGGSSSSGPSAAIAGTLGLNVLDHQTTASIDNGSSLTLTDGGAGVNLRALSGGQAVSVGLGLAVSTGSTSNLATIVGSGSVTVDRNTTQAKLTDATLKDTGASNGNGVNVQALDAVKVGTGGGSLMISKGGKAGIGMAVSVAMLQNHTTASMAGGKVSGFSGMAVQAFSPGLIGSAAAVASLNLGSNTPLNLAGAVVVNEISNTTNATIGADAAGKQASVTVDKSLTVQASSQDASALETVLNDSTQSLGYDFAGVGLDALGIDTSNGATAPTLGGQTDNGKKSPTFTAASSTPSSTPGASIIGVAGSFALSKGGAASAGLSAVYNAIDNQITAQVGDASVTVGSSNAGGTLDISATNATRLIGVAAGASVGQGKFSAVGSFSINNLSGNATTALLGDTQATTNSTTVQGAGKNPGVSVNASDSGTIWSGAGGVSAGGKAGVGAAMALNLAGQQTTAQVSHAKLTASGLTVGATSSSSIDSLAVAVAAASKAAFGGSLNLTIDTGKTQALVGNSDLTLTGALSNTATDSSAIWDGAGAVAASSAAGVGIGVAVNVTHHNTIAKLSSDTLSAAKQAVTVNAKNTGFIAAGGIGAAGSGKVAAGLGVVVNVANDQVSANVNDVNGGTPTSAATLGSLGVSATDSSTVYALGGALAGAGNAALGGAVTVNWLGQQVGAGLAADTLDVGGALDVNATSSGKIGALAAAVAGGGNAAFAGAVTTNFISGSTTASDVNSTLSGVGLTLALKAHATPTIDAIGIGASGSGSAAVGAGVALNSLSGTTQAYIEGGSVGTTATPAQNVVVQADSQRTINTLAAGAGVGGDFGAAGGIVTDLLNGTTKSYIDGGAQVLASDYVAVTAKDNNTLKAATGNLAFGTFGGLGLSVAVNVLNDTTQAYIGQGNGKTDVTALGQGSGVSVADGQLNGAPSVGGSISDTSYSAPTLTEGSTTVHGVAVNAQSLNVGAGLAVGLAASGDPASAALQADSATNVLGGKTQAYVDGAVINTLSASGQTPAKAQTVSVIAGRHDFATGIATGVAAGAGVSGVGAVEANSFNATTQAYLLGGTVDAKGAVNVNAYATQDSTALAAGLAAGLAGGAGSGAINLYQDTTQAYAQSGAIDAQSLDIEAHNNTGVNLISGSLSIGAGGSLGASVLINVGQNTTQAWLGDAKATSRTTTAKLTGGDLTVKAGSSTTLSLLGITGSLSGASAVAGAVNAMVLNNTTGANIYNATLTGAKNATVLASDTTDVSGSYAGGLGAGLDAGVGVALNLLIARNTVEAGVSGSSLTTTGAVSVEADSTKYANLFTVAGGAGGEVGIGGAVSLILSGSSSSQHVTDVQNSLHKKNSNGDSVASSLNSVAGTSSTQNDASLSSTQQQNYKAQSTYAPGGDIITPTSTSPDATTATVSDSTITAGSLSVSAKDTTATQNVAGGLAAGGAAGVGAGVAVTSSNDKVGSKIEGGQTTAPAVSVAASAVNGSKQDGAITLDKAADVKALDGSAGLFFGGGAAVAVGTVNNAVSAEVTPATVGGATLTGDSSGNVQITAKDGESAKTTAAGLNVGGLAVGAAVGVATRSSHVTAGLTGTANQYKNVTLTANSSGTVDSNATGIAAGIYSGNAVVATATDVSAVNAAVGANSSFDISGGALQVGAVLNPTITAKATGVSVGVGSVGASVATAQEGSNGVKGSAIASVGDNVTVGGSGGLAISSQASPTISSDAVAGTGALLGGQAVTSKASNAIDVEAKSGAGLSLPAGDVVLNAVQTGSVSATGSGVLGALLGAGAVIVEADASPTVLTELGAGASSAASRAGALLIQASGNDVLDAHSTSGAGGGGIGNAAKATTNLNAITTAQTDGTSGTVHAGAFVLSAKHSATVKNRADSTNVSVAGGGAALADNTVNSTVNTTYGGGTFIQADSGMIVGRNSVDFPDLGWNAHGAAGGAFNVNVVKASANLDLITNVVIDPQPAGTTIPELAIVGDPTQPTVHALVIAADNNVKGSLQAKVATGGVVQGLNASAHVSGTSTATVNIKSGARISAIGNVIVTSGTDGNIQTNALAHTWGGAGVLSSSAVTNLTAKQLIDVAGSIRSSNNIWIGAGYNANLGMDTLSVGATSHSYNYTVLAVGTNPSASAHLTNSNNVSISGAVLAGGSAAVQAVSGVHSAGASAVGENSYTKVIDEIIHFFSGLINKIAHKTVIKPISLDYHGGTSNDVSSSGVTVSSTGKVEAGLAGKQNLTLNELNGKIVASQDSSPLIQYNLTNKNYYQALLDRQQQLQNDVKTASSQSAGLYFFELEMVQNELNALYEVHPATGKQILDSAGNPVVNPEAKAVPTVTLSPILARSGNVTINGGSTKISGTVAAYGVQGVNIENNTPAFLNVGDITVQGGGGQVYINGALNAADSHGGTGAPPVAIDNSYTPPTAWSNGQPPPVAPDINLNGTIYDPTGKVTVTNSAGSIHQNGTVNAASVSIAALDGGFFQGYKTGYHNPGNLTPVTNPQASIIAGGAVFVAAQYLNVNGLIQSGHSQLNTTMQSGSNRVNVLSSGLGATLSMLHSYYTIGGMDALETAITKANTTNGNENLSYDSTTGYVRVTPKASITNPDIIPTFWDPSNNRLVLNAAVSKPGRVYLYGNIFNTSPNGKIVAASGLANIQVDNQTGLPLIVERINAGEADAGGLVQIVDTAKSYTTGSGTSKKSWNLVTEYRYSPTTGDISTYHFGAGAPGVYGSANSTTYMPTLSLSNTSQDSYQIATNGHGVWYAPAGGATVSEGSNTYTLSQGLYRPQSSDLTVTDLNKGSYNLNYDLFGISFSQPVSSSDYWLLTTCQSESFCTVSPSLGSGTKITEAWNKISGLYKADNPIGIQFTGPSVGTVNVKSSGGIWLKGVVSNPTGSVTLDSANGAVGSLSSEAAITGKNVTIKAASGIGSGLLKGVMERAFTFSWPGFGSFTWNWPQPTQTPSLPLLVNLAGTGGALNAATANGDINVTSQGKLALGLVSAPQGSVTLAGQNGVAGTIAGSTAVVSGGDINLSATNGAISGLAADSGALLIDATGAVNASAQNGAINLTQTSGDFHVGKVVAAGDVTLSAPQGSIVSALSQTVNQKALQQLQKAWTSYGLLSNSSGSNTDAQKNLTSLENNFALAYSQYWTLKKRVVFSGSGSSLTITGLTQAGYDAYKGAAAAYNGISANSVTQAQIQSYVTNVLGSSLVQQYNTANTQLAQLTQQAQQLPSLSTATLDPSTYARQSYGFSSAQATQLQGYLSTENASGFKSLVDNVLSAHVTRGASWTQDQLLHTVSQQAVIGSTQLLHTQAPNITTPGTVTLKASSTLGNIAAPVTIQLDSAGDVTLTPLQEAALAVAAPGDVTTTTSSTGTTITISEHHPVYLYGTGTGAVDAQAQNGLYLTAGIGDLNVGTLNSPGGQIRLAAQGSILQAVGGKGVTGAAGGAVLSAVSGSIGSDSAPLNMDLTGPLDSARASGDIYIDQTSGGLQLGNFYAGGTGSITVDKAGISSLFADATTPHLQASHLILSTAGDVGSAVPLAVTLGTGGLSGQVGGALDVVSPTADLAVSKLTATGAVTLNAVLGALKLDSLTSKAAAGPAVTLTAGTSIEGTSPSGTADIAAPAKGAEVSLTAGTDIGSRGRYLMLDAPVLKQADASTGSVYIQDMQGLTADSVHALNGAVGLKVNGDLSFGSVIAGGNANLSSAGAQKGNNLSAGGSFVDTAGGNGMTIDTVSAQQASLNATDGSIGLGTLTATQGQLSALHDIDLRQAWIADQLALYANGNISANLTQRPANGQAFGLSVAGYEGQGLAGTLNLHADVPGELNFPVLHVIDATLTLRQPQVSIDNGYIGGWMKLNTPQASLLMDNVDPVLRNVDFQLYQPKATFELALRGQDLFTSAYVERYAPGYVATVPNYWMEHASTAVDYTTGSAVRNAGNLLANGLRLRPLPHGFGVQFRQPSVPMTVSGGRLVGVVNTSFVPQNTHHRVRAH